MREGGFGELAYSVSFAGRDHEIVAPILLRIRHIAWTESGAAPAESAGG